MESYRIGRPTAYRLEEMLIEAVRKHPCIWNSSLKSYKDQEAKDIAWLTIAERLRIPDVKIAKLKWKSIRDVHREILRRHTTDDGLAKPIKWKNFKRMDFLLPYVGSSELQSRVHLLNYDGKDLSEDAMIDDTVETIFLPDQVDDDSLDGDSKIEKFRGSIEGLEKIDWDQTLLDESEPKRLNLTFASNSSTQFNQDPLGQLFSSMYETTKKLPEALQLRIKRTLFDVVSKAEEEYLNSNYTNSSQLNESENNVETP